MNSEKTDFGEKFRSQLPIPSFLSPGTLPRVGHGPIPARCSLLPSNHIQLKPTPPRSLPHSLSRTTPTLLTPSTHPMMVATPRLAFGHDALAGQRAHDGYAQLGSAPRARSDPSSIRGRRAKVVSPAFEFGFEAWCLDARAVSSASSDGRVALGRAGQDSSMLGPVHVLSAAWFEASLCAALILCSVGADGVGDARDGAAGGGQGSGPVLRGRRTVADAGEGAGRVTSNDDELAVVTCLSVSHGPICSLTVSPLCSRALRRASWMGKGARG